MWYWLAGVLLAIVLLPIILSVIFHYYVLFRYMSDIRNIFERKPFFLPQSPPPPDHAVPIEDVRTADGRRINAHLIEHQGEKPAGTIIFCHEFSANGWLCSTYLDFLRRDGFNILTFDFCNHGGSDAIADYSPLQWTTNHELADFRAVMSSARKTLDQSLPVGVFGVSKGGSVALTLAHEFPEIKAIVTDGAFPTRSTVYHFIIQWVSVVVRQPYIYPKLPRIYFRWLALDSVKKIAKLNHVEYPHVRQGIRRLTAPWLLIHGEKDNYIQMPIVEDIFRAAKGQKEMWVVKKAKHNHCLDKAGDEYRNRVRNFFWNHLLGKTPASPIVTPKEENTPASSDNNVSVNGVNDSSNQKSGPDKGATDRQPAEHQPQDTTSSSSNQA